MSSCETASGCLSLYAFCLNGQVFLHTQASRMLVLNMSKALEYPQYCAIAALRDHHN